MILGVLPLAAACTADNPAFGLSTDGVGDTGGSTAVDAGTGAMSTAPTTGVDPTATSGPTTGVSGDPTASSGATSGTTGVGTTGNAPFCGDGHVDPGEACDDGNTLDGDGCEGDCSLVSCGDGIIQMGEDCDDANQVDTDACLSTCVAASCGDGLLFEDVEQCDDGANNGDDEQCTASCHFAVCGDGLVWSGMEECDDGNGIDTDECTNACKKPTCGDGIVSDGEKCDDGNQVDTDKCTNTCMPGPCGDAQWEPNIEACDGSAEPFKGIPGLCSEACTVNACATIANGNNTNDIVGNSWFDPCVDAIGNTLYVFLVTKGGKLVYNASATKPLAWTYDTLTSTDPPDTQWVLGNHKPVVLNNGDRLFLFGRSGKPLALQCPSSLGDGYGAAIMAPAPSDAFKVLGMSTVGPKTGKLRNFNNWSANHEISFSLGGMSLCVNSGPIAAPDHYLYFLVK